MKSDGEAVRMAQPIGVAEESVPTVPSKPENYAAPSTKAEHAHGVLYQGEFETVSDGTAQAVRLHARALADTGIPVLLRSFSSTVVNADGVAEPVHLVGLPPEVDTEVGPLTKTSIAETRTLIMVTDFPPPRYYCARFVSAAGLSADFSAGVRFDHREEHFVYDSA